MRILFLLVFLLFGHWGWAQLGIKGGFYNVQVNPDPVTVEDPNQNRQFELSLKDARYGFHIGAFYKIRMNKFFIQPELVLNSNSSTYTLKDAFDIETQLEENYQYLDIPVMLGFDLGVINFFGGPVGHVFVGSTSELNELEGFRQKWNDLTWGWQAGIGFDIWRLNLDLRYEGNFYRYGEHMEFFGSKVNFEDSPHRIITSVAFLFGS